MAVGFNMVKCCCFLFLYLCVGQSEAGGPFIHGLERLAHLFRLPPPHPPPPPPQLYFHPRGGPITSLASPLIHGYSTPVYQGTKFLIARSPILPPLGQDPDFVRFFYQQAPSFFNVPSLYSIPHGPPSFFGLPDGYGSFEKYTGPTTVYKEQPSSATSDGEYGAPPPPPPLASDDYEPPSSGGYSSPNSGGYSSPVSSGYSVPISTGYPSSSGGYVSSSGGYGGPANSGAPESGSGGYSGPASSGGSGYGPSGGGSSGANDGAGGSSNAGAGAGAGANPSGLEQNQDPNRFRGFGDQQETGPSGRASSDKQENSARPKPAGATPGAGTGNDENDQQNQSDLQLDEPEVGFRSLDGVNFLRIDKKKEKGRKVTAPSADTDDEIDDALDYPSPTKDPFKSSPFLSQFIDTNQSRKKKPTSTTEKYNDDEPIQFRSPLNSDDLFDYTDDFIDKAVDEEKSSFRPQTKQQQRAKNDVVPNKGKPNQNSKKKFSNPPNTDKVIFDEVDVDQRNADTKGSTSNRKGGSSRREQEPKPTIDYDVVGTTGSGDSEDSVKPTSGGYDEAKPTGGYDEEGNTSTSSSDATKAGFGARVKPTSSSNTRNRDRDNINRRKKSAQPRQNQRANIREARH